MVQGVSDKLDSLVASLVAGPPRPATDASVRASGAQPSPAAPTAGQPAVNVNDPEITAAADKVNQELRKQTNDKMSLAIDKDTNRIIVRYKDPQSGEVVRQFPAAAILEMVKRLDKLKGTMLDSQG
ncbi:MAG: flagellar protein FlaG [Nitrospinae bacterium]|nr:flagellar protein FlaG [Nitrospinota bacterium]